MSLLHQVDPESFISTTQTLPANGRGAWSRTGIGFEYRYALAVDVAQRIGTQAQVSLAHWAAAAGSYALQTRLVDLGHLGPLSDGERGIFGPRTEKAVRAFQAVNVDPMDRRPLSVDGLVGMSDARSLFTPLVLSAQKKYGIPNSLLLGQTNHESMMDPGAVGYYIYYPDYRGVDRAMSQINSKAQNQVSWLEAFSPAFALEWSAKRMRGYFDKYRAEHPETDIYVLWDAAACAHNSPRNGSLWAENGGPANDSSATYMNAVKKAVY